MSDPTLVRVNLGERSYDIAIGSGILANSGAFAIARRKISHAILIADEAVANTHAAAVAVSLQATGARVDVLTVPSGEASKNISVAEGLWNKLIELRADRKSVVFAVGGGVIGDLAGFVAATFTRGLDFFQVPTTLLAQVDSSVGGKTGVNLPRAKNMVGAFAQPAGVIIDTDTLGTLPDREYISGLAEVVKYGVILDAEFFAYLEQTVAALNARDPAALAHIIARSCRLKADVVERDERETTGLRAILNYGHTFCHAIEATAGYGRFLHGEAVSIGMHCAAILAEQIKMIGPELRPRQAALLAKLRLPVALPRLPELQDEALLAAMRLDKKVEHGALRFILPRCLGSVELVPGVPEAAVRRAFESARSEVLT